MSLFGSNKEEVPVEEKNSKALKSFTGMNDAKLEPTVLQEASVPGEELYSAGVRVGKSAIADVSATTIKQQEVTQGAENNNPNQGIGSSKPNNGDIQRL
ncbi:MAG: hypothetical protein HOM96_04685 [Rickettsiales bacterium]|jgi:hypothetical protein|nr:hypothetical protein [Rickettsiales bacterium]